jgi:hypothetical protein
MYGAVVIPPREKMLIHVDRYPMCWQPSSPTVAYLDVLNFRECFAISERMPILVKPVRNEEDKDRARLPRLINHCEHYFADMVNSSIGMLDIRLLLTIGNPRSGVGVGYRVLQTWEPSEASFSEGTFRDELRLSRILFQ